MAEYFTEENSGGLILKGEYSNSLDVESFSLMMKNPSFCYKFYWLEAIVKLISEGIKVTTFNDIIDEMISNAWYSVREFHIHLSGMQNGEARDGIERAITKLTELSEAPSNASKTEIKNVIKKYDNELKQYKIQLTNMVPYRALAGFFQKYPETPVWESRIKMTRYISKVNEVITLPYIMGESSGLNKEVLFNPEWIKLIQDNTVSIIGWIQYEKLKWLQMNNPEVPGLVYKLKSLDEKGRKLNKVRKLWNGILETNIVYDVFTDKEIKNDNYDIDHFIPWSFVMNDELWNLGPMISSLNSVKSNKLPKWDPFFRNFANNQYLLYSQIQKNETIDKLFIDCYKDNLFSIWANQELYKFGNTKEQFYNILEKNMRPVYDSAKRQGYEIWNY